MPQDASGKLLFSHPRMVEDLLGWFITGPWSDALDFATLENRSAAFVSDDLRRRHGDSLWRLRCGETWLYVALEFQSTVDRSMAVRLLTYAGLLYQDLYRRAEVSRDGKLPPVLPVVFLPCGNLVSALILLENSRTPAELERALDALLGWVPGPGEHGLKRAFGEWIRRVLLRGRFPEAILERTAELEEVRTCWKNRCRNGRGSGSRKVLSRANRHCCAVRRRGSSTQRQPNDFRIC